MITSFDIALPVGAIGLYLYDSVRLLYSNELLVERQNGTWRVYTGSNFLLAGRRPCLPNPLRPMNSLLSARWSATSDEVVRAVSLTGLDQFEGAVRPLKPLIAVLLSLLLVVLPVVSVYFGAGMPLLALFVSFYGVVIATLWTVYHKREALGLSAGRVVTLAIDSLLCAPFAINLIRKITLDRADLSDAVSLAKNLLSGAARDHAVVAMLSDTAARSERVEPGSETHIALQRFSQRLREMAG